MRISKIGSNGTYHRCLKELHQWGYLNYMPSHNPLKGSFVKMFKFESTSEQLSKQVVAQDEVQALVPYINSINNTNNVNSSKTINTKNQNLESSKKNIIPSLDHLIQFFKENNFPSNEAEKFFNYYESNGWKIGGRTPMKNWRAAAKNWMLNVEKFNPGTKTAQQTDNLHTNQDKDYTIPL